MHCKSHDMCEAEIPLQDWWTWPSCRLRGPEELDGVDSVGLRPRLPGGWPACLAMLWVDQLYLAFLSDRQLDRNWSSRCIRVSIVGYRAESTPQLGTLDLPSSGARSVWRLPLRASQSSPIAGMVSRENYACMGLGNDMTRTTREIEETQESY